MNSVERLTVGLDTMIIRTGIGNFRIGSNVPMKIYQQEGTNHILGIRFDDEGATTPILGLNAKLQLEPFRNHGIYASLVSGGYLKVQFSLASILSGGLHNQGTISRQDFYMGLEAVQDIMNVGDVWYRRFFENEICRIDIMRDPVNIYPYEAFRTAIYCLKAPFQKIREVDGTIYLENKCHKAAFYDKKSKNLEDDTEAPEFVKIPHYLRAEYQLLTQRKIWELCKIRTLGELAENLEIVERIFYDYYAGIFRYSKSRLSSRG